VNLRVVVGPAQTLSSTEAGDGDYFKDIFAWFLARLITNKKPTARQQQKRHNAHRYVIIMHINIAEMCSKMTAYSVMRVSD